jgi:hypothetical protein
MKSFAFGFGLGSSGTEQLGHLIGGVGFQSFKGQEILAPQFLFLHSSCIASMSEGSK